MAQSKCFRNILLRIAFNCHNGRSVSYPLKFFQSKITVPMFYDVELQCINCPSECWSKPKLPCQENLGLLHKISSGTYPWKIIWPLNQIYVLLEEKILPLLLIFMQRAEMRGAPSRTSPPQAIWFLLVGIYRPNSQLE